MSADHLGSPRRFRRGDVVYLLRHELESPSATGCSRPPPGQPHVLFEDYAWSWSVRRLRVRRMLDESNGCFRPPPGQPHVLFEDYPTAEWWANVFESSEAAEAEIVRREKLGNTVSWNPWNFRTEAATTAE